MVFQIRSDEEELALARRAAAPNASSAGLRRLLDTTMLFAPKSGGVKRYLLAKRAWFAENRPEVRHTLVVPGATNWEDERGMVSIAAARLPFGDGYRWPASTKKWADRLVELRPSLIEAGDPYAPGRAALDAGDRLGAPVVGFCHSDPAQLAALHLGEWAEPPVRRRWARLFRRFDQVVAPSKHIAERLAFAGVFNVKVQPLGVDTRTFHPARADAPALRKRLGLSADKRLLVFVGRPAREKNVEMMLEAVARLGPAYHLLLVGAGALSKPQPNATFLDYERDPKEVAKLIAGCDAFLHANPNEPFGLVALEAMACGKPLVGVASGGVSEIVDERVGVLAPRATAACLAEAIEALFEKDLAAMGLAARALVEERYGWDAVFNGLSGLYDDLVGTPPARTSAEIVQLSRWLN